MTEPHFLFDSIFSNTHSELSSIHDQMKELQMNYQSNETNEITIPYEGESFLIEPIVIEPVLIELEDKFILDELILGKIISDEPISDEPILNDDQINKFKKIYSKSKIEDIDDEDNNSIQKIKIKLSQNDEEAQLKKLQTKICCKQTCLQKLIPHKHTITFYQKFQNLNNNQEDMFLLGVLSATARSETTTKGQKRQRLASSYVFEGVEICNKAFLTIYGIGERYWDNIRAHFTQHGISPRIHKLTGKVSNFAISFEEILGILTFIINYANIHGLPSPGIYNQFFLYFVI